VSVMGLTRCYKTTVFYIYICRAASSTYGVALATPLHEFTTSTIVCLARRYATFATL